MVQQLLLSRGAEGRYNARDRLLHWEENLVDGAELSSYSVGSGPAAEGEGSDGTATVVEHETLRVTPDLTGIDVPADVLAAGVVTFQAALVGNKGCPAKPLDVS